MVPVTLEKVMVVPPVTVIAVAGESAVADAPAGP